MNDLLKYMYNASICGLLVLLVYTVTLTSAGYQEHRPYYYPIFAQPQQHYYRAGFHNVHNGVAASYRNDDRQQYVNAVANSHGSGLGTAPWYGVPGTSFDFSHSNVEGYKAAFDTHHHGGHGGGGGGGGGGFGGGGGGYGHHQPTYSYHAYGGYGH